jgi:hypothetical protein
MKKIIIAFTFLLLLSPKIRGQEYTASQVHHPQYNFALETFRHPVLSFGPLTRWWWPGNNVTSSELEREIALFADNGFAGVEIQPFNINISSSSDDVLQKVLSWDTPEFYRNVKVVLEEAKKKGLIVDMNNGSGWPAGGPHVQPGDGILTLKHESIDIEGASDISMKIPEVYNPTDEPATLIAVVASKEAPENKNIDSKTIPLDPSSTIVLTDKVKDGMLEYRFPTGKWKLIAFWSVPQSLTGSMVAAPQQGQVINHFDSTKVFKNYEYLFGERTGIPLYYGNPLRAVFNDSYEFAVDRFFSNEFIAYFKKKRGYDITPWLGANMQHKYNYVEYKNPHRQPDFYFSEQDWRLRYDYDLTISEMFGEHFIAAGSKWLEQRGMLHRSQVYGFQMDMIANAGMASIPETESMAGAEVNLKIMSSGAHLYNRPLLSAESVVFAKRAYMTTPQKIRMAVDKLFAAGVTQIIYHGVPYRIDPDPTTGLGWYPFYMGKNVSFSAHLGEGTQFWKHQKEVNEYIARTQYVLRAGKPHSNILIYFPFMTAEGMPDNPTEILAKGYFPDVEPPLGSTEKTQKEKEEWAEKVYPIINLLESHGITWEWGNDESIQAATIDDDRLINIRGNRYQALMLAGTDMIQLNSAKRIDELALGGVNFVAVGDLPSKQPSFLNWEENDRATACLIEKACKETNSKHLQNLNDLTKWIANLNQPIKFNGVYDFTRQIEREMSDGSRVRFIWNKSDQWQLISLALDAKYKKAYWLNAENGAIIPSATSNEISYRLPPYSSIILYTSTHNRIDDNLLSPTPDNIYQSAKVQEISNWNIQVGTLKVENTTLFDWKNNEILKFTSEEGVYTASFSVAQIDKKSTYLIDLGKVCYTAEVFVNGKFLGNRIYTPYLFNVSDILKKGNNTIEVRVIPGALNGLLGEGVKGNPRYHGFKDRTNETMSSGLLGPVILYKR